MFAQAFAEYALAGAAGVATIASPCILPVLPIVLATTAGRSKLEPLLIVAGFTASFAAGGIALGALSAISGEWQYAVRTAAIAMLLLAGLSCLWSAPFDWLAAQIQRRLTSGVSAGPARTGKLGALLIGASLGLVWTPCAGPILASVLALAASAQAPAKATALLGLYALGAGVPLLAIAYGGHWVSARLAFFNRHAVTTRRIFGAVAIAVALLQLLQYDVLFSAWATQWLPAVSTGL
ncbi:cytochrome c biogenesis CcdA family protein [Pseudomonas sp. CGJS7]|uniref:cytochrome c biogenesis CcdA family protein n=1 Tax=Pseudomonas sp. CGJS7 TaxID=3109348 RepID=UPI0030080584